MLNPVKRSLRMASFSMRRMIEDGADLDGWSCGKEREIVGSTLQESGERSGTNPWRPWTTMAPSSKRSG